MLFSGGRGSGALTSQLVSNPRVDLVVAINGYDDGASTGEVRRFLGDALGPSDFRKNASRLSRTLRTAPEALVDLLDQRLPDDLQERSTARALVTAMTGASPDARLDGLARLAGSLPEPACAAVRRALERFAEELETSGRPFRFADTSVGNLVFAGSYLLAGRRFNAAVDAYCALLGLPDGLVENVTDGTDAHLVAIDADGRLIGSEEEIVDAKRRNRIDDIHLLSARPTPAELSALSALGREDLARQLAARAATIALNPRLAAALADADLIVYAPGTQHSSLFPSYLTPGLSDAIASNLTAIKLLVTNIQADAEITGSSAVDIIERAVFYLKEKGRLSIATPCLITHYLLNDPRQVESDTPYVPLGRLDSLEDPRLVRVGNYEDGVTGRHDAAKILGPFVDAFVERVEGIQRVAVYLHDAGTATKVVQSILEMIRGGIRDLPVSIAVFHDGPADLEQSFAASVGFPVTRLAGSPAQQDRQLRAALASGVQGPQPFTAVDAPAEVAQPFRAAYDYVVLFESSGMYNGEDIANLASHLSLGRLDAVWGSRRLSVKDIHESYRLKYRHRSLLGAVSYVGSHALSLLYLGLYGRYVSDTLSGARVVRTADVLQAPGLLNDKLVNQHLLSILLRRRAEMFEIPVQFFSMAPEQVKRTTPIDGLRAAATVLQGRIR